MKLRWLILLTLLTTLPTLVQARWIKDQVSIQVDATGPVEFSHYNHLEAVGNDCPTCHNGLFHIVAAKNKPVSMKDMEKGKSCGACHNGQKAFGVKEDCSTCHPTRDIVFEEEDAGNVLFSHEVHTGMFGCDECHPDLYRPGSDNPTVTMDEMSEGESCGACHDDSSAFTVEDNCDTCHQME